MKIGLVLIIAEHVEHLMFHLIAYKPAAIRQLEECLHIYRNLSHEQRQKRTI
jgi:hypothetical protein